MAKGKMVFAQGELLKPRTQPQYPVPQGRWRRWMSILRQPADPPQWMSESFSYFVLGIAVTALVAAVTIPISAEFFPTKVKNGEKTVEPNYKLLFVEFGFAAVCLGCAVGGCYAWIVCQKAKEYQANMARIVADEMEEFESQLTAPVSAPALPTAPQPVDLPPSDLIATAKPKADP